MANVSFQNVLFIGRPHIVVSRDRDEELRIAFRGLQLLAFLNICHESAAMERADSSDTIEHNAAVRNAIGPPMQYPQVPIFQVTEATDDWRSSH